jgi:hypothetical protein
MIYETRNRHLFKKFWMDEKEHMPRWFVDGTNSKKVTWQEFQDFCHSMWRIYSIDDKALVYFEKIRNHANVHFSLLRGEKIDTEPLISIRDEIIRDVNLIFGWSGTHNRGLCKMLEAVGFQYDGLKMLFGESHGRVLEWKCYTYKKPLAVRDKTLLLST